MLSKEDLKAIKELFDGQFKKIDERFEKIDDQFEKIGGQFETVHARLDKMERRMETLEFKQDHMAKKLDDLQLNGKISEREIRRDIRHLRDDVETLAEVMKQHELLPQ